MAEERFTSRMRFPFPRLLLFAAVLTVTSAPFCFSAPPVRAFIERVKPVDYFDAEKVFPEPYSHSHELVILRTTAQKPVSVLAIKHAAEGTGYTMTIALASADSPGGWLKLNEDLDETFAKQVLRAMEFKLHRQVSLSDFKRTMSKTDTDIWLFQRVQENRAAAAVIMTEAAMDNPAATRFIDDFLGNLERLAGTEGKDRELLLQKIDRLASEIILSEGGTK